MKYKFVANVTAENDKSADIYEVVDMIFKEEDEVVYSAHTVGEPPTKKNNVFFGILFGSIDKAVAGLNAI